MTPDRGDTLKRRLANWLIDREDRDQWVPLGLWQWVFRLLWNHGTPVTIRVRSTPVAVRVRSTSNLIEVNPAPRTWTSGTVTVITYPLSPDNPYAR
jgi:hypothetical protein